MSGAAPVREGGRLVLRSLLGGGIAYLALFLAVHATLAAGPDLWAPLDVLLLVLVGGPQAFLVLRGREDLDSGRTAVLCASLAAAAAIGIWMLPTGAGGTSYAAWFLGAITFTLLGLTLVGRVRAAWLTLATIAALAVVWAVLTGQGAGAGIGLVVRHAATLLVGTALAIGLRRSNAAYRASRVRERGRRAEEQAARASTTARRTAVEGVLEQAGPMLQAIGDGRALTPEDRRQLLVLEGALRDQIRTPRLTNGLLRASVDAARRRGVNVLLMDEAPDVDEAIRRQGGGWLADRLDGVVDGAFVGRLRELDGALRVSAVTDAGTSAMTFEPTRA